MHPAMARPPILSIILPSDAGHPQHTVPHHVGVASHSLLYPSAMILLRYLHPREIGGYILLRREQECVLLSCQRIICAGVYSAEFPLFNREAQTNC